MATRIFLQGWSILVTMKTKQTRTIHLSRSKYGLTGTKKFFNDWIAQIRVNGKTHKIGIYPTAHAAHMAYLRTAKALGIKVKIKP
jgi:hypothetical protein